MSDRSAVDTIKGYFYQFDYSIDVLLNLAKDDEIIELECIEDVTIETATESTAVQCKYYAKTEYNHSVIKEPIMFMLSHFKEVKAGTKKKMNYLLWGHYSSGQSKLTIPFDVIFLKEHFLTYTKTEDIGGTKTKITHYHHLDLGLDDTDLLEFIGLLKININAKEFDKQYQDIITTLKSTFKCSQFTAEYFYYNNALRVIRELTIKSLQADRKISKKEFLNKINIATILFNEWFVKIKGKKAHYAGLKKEYFTFLNVSPFERFFLIEVDPTTYDRSELKELIFIISKKWTKISKREPTPFCPYVYIHGLHHKELIELKKELFGENFILIDGFDFEGSEFNPHSIIKKPDSNNQVKLKIVNSSAHIEQALNVINKTKKIYQFHLNEPYYELDKDSVSHVKIQVEKLTDIKNII